MAYLRNCTCQMEGFGNITRATPLSQCHCFISHLTGMPGGVTVPSCLHVPAHSDILRPLACPYLLGYTEVLYMSPPFLACPYLLGYTEVPYYSDIPRSLTTRMYRGPLLLGCTEVRYYSDKPRSLTCPCLLRYTKVPYMSPPLPQPMNWIPCARGVCPRG